jgi:hypothetical protein
MTLTENLCCIFIISNRQTQSLSAAPLCRASENAKLMSQCLSQIERGLGCTSYSIANASFEGDDRILPVCASTAAQRSYPQRRPLSTYLNSSTAEQFILEESRVLSETLLFSLEKIDSILSAHHVSFHSVAIKLCLHTFPAGAKSSI